ncbi:heat-shock protein [Bordetella genomosp. 5]|uniref:Hsp70 family protein n=1 Tax=Bordetella genomosp. 5 TaxID=1395608 RepID=UPI000B9E7189|nr:Hsp70 family protein [Bordetella genomosp. 5]OZI47813.1 heat-shock protein [Bordetella genomosp. 5]
MTSPACGVDFGTSNSTVGLARAGQPSLLLLEDGKGTLPSAIFFHDDDDEVSYGRAAIADYVAGYDGRLMRSMKSLLGTSLMEGSTEVQGRAVPFRVLLTRFIAELKRRAEQASGQPLRQAVFGRPVFFVDDSTTADQLAQDTLGEIARDVGFTHVEFQFEPIAAAFDYESQIDSEELVLVVDIGGGTSDFTLIRLGPARAGKVDRRDDILAHGGVHIGGTDFDKQLSLGHVMPLFGLGSQLRSGKDVPSTQFGNLACWHTINQAYTKKAAENFAWIRQQTADPARIGLLDELVRQRAGHWVAIQVEEAKIALSEAPATHIPLDRIAPGLGVDVTRPGFDGSIEGLIGRVERTVNELIASAGVPASAVDTVFFTGGSSRVPLLRSSVAALVPAARSVEGDLFGSIGAGLALDASRRFA